ncbi:MAG: molybdopterin-guanine dinucleotide biosynthesis protein B [Candidatus Thermoplasmatota archaeon]|nr:molybdopterin-guanine dinucleotide biosynthesis protein B [Candidatus Thermoplasmatota archaeon]MBS3790994.1 molybdopterin-guanine dinucleotide biosynthesis protein B [Candidatus Thermoplasmatota archaeon]
MRKNIPKFGVVGRSESGKTNLICSLISRLKERDYSVASVKHTRGDFSIDSEGKDTWRHSKAGSELVVFSTPDETDFLIKKSLSLDEIISLIDHFGDYDILLVEGMKKGKLPKIDVDRENREGTFIEYENNLEEIVNSIEEWVRIYEQLPGLDCGDCGFENCDEMTESIYEGKKRIEDCKVKKAFKSVKLFVDGKRVPLGDFPANLIEKTVRGMLGSLKGIDGEEESIEIKIAKEDS